MERTKISEVSRKKKLCIWEESGVRGREALQRAAGLGDHGYGGERLSSILRVSLEGVMNAWVWWEVGTPRRT